MAIALGGSEDRPRRHTVGRPCQNGSRIKAVMATAATKTVFPHITTDPQVCHGRPCIAGTRVRVMDIVAAHEEGVSPAELQSHFATRPLTLAEIYAALAYYNDHKDEIEAERNRRSGKMLPSPASFAS